MPASRGMQGCNLKTLGNKKVLSLAPFLHAAKAARDESLKIVIV